jgi:uncharacterized protein (TIGR02996 family)
MARSIIGSTVPRYLDPSGTKFWEIERTRATITRRAGRLGQKGRVQTRTFANPMLARWNYGNFVGHKTWTEKYRLDGPDLPAPVDELPADDDARLVHADALQARGDPLGELIALQHAWRAERDEATKATVGRAIDELFTRNADAWFGDLACARALFYFGWYLGRLRRVRLGPDSDPAPWLRAIWHDVLPEVPACYVLGTLLEALFELPIARQLETLTVGSVGTVDYQHTMLAITNHAPPTLRKLELHPHAPIQADAMLAPLNVPGLVELSCELSLCAAALAQLADASWPNLRRLDFAIAASASTEVHVLGPLLAATNAPALKRVAIDVGAPGPLCRALAAAPLTGQLEELAIRHRLELDPGIRAALVERAPFVTFKSSR